MSNSFTRKAVFSGLLFAAVIAAQPPQGCRHGEQGPGMEGDGNPDCQHHEQMAKDFDKELNLTPDQKTKLQALREEGKTARHEHMQKMKDLRQKMKDELSKDKPDGARLMEYASQTADLVEQQTKSHVDHLLKVKQILNKEQFEKMLSREAMGRGKRDCPAEKGECEKMQKKNGK